MRPDQCGAKQENSFPFLAGDSVPDASQDRAVPPAARALLADVQLFRSLSIVQPVAINILGKKTSFCCPPWFFSASTPVELWLPEFSPYSDKKHFSILPMSPDHISTWNTPFFYFLISMRRFLFSQASLLPSLLDLQHLGLVCSCLLRR